MGQSFRELIAWQRSMDLVTDIYCVTPKPFHGTKSTDSHHSFGVPPFRSQVTLLRDKPGIRIANSCAF